MKKLDKKNWPLVRFGEVARSLNESERDPLAAGLTRYVGLDHIEPGSLHLRAWGNVADGTTFTRTFRAGNVLFGKRRAYQRKAAVADFDGLCSGDILVMEANEKRLLPSLLPFLVHSDGFFDHAVRTSAGSLSPRTKFKDLAEYEFRLPPREQQQRLAELLWAADEMGEKAKELSCALNEAASAVFEKVNQSDNCQHLLLGDCLEYTQYGTSEQLNEVGGIPVLRMNNLKNGKLDTNDLKYISRDELGKNLLLKKGDILFNRTNSFDLVGKVALFDSDEEMSFASYLIKLKTKDEVIRYEYLNFYLNSGRGQKAIKKHRTPGVSQSNINPENLKKILVPVVPLDEQSETVIQIANITLLAEQASESQLGSKEIARVLLNEIFSA